MNEKRLVVEINQDLHQDIKIRAVFRHLSLKQWVTRAIIEEIKREKLTE
jgi:predicted HicB family RNase H-like nuclease